jgi:glycosyltransferase involved in cell wall biosynthesis
MLTAVVIAKNEAKNISVCIPTLSFANEVLVIDNGSTDQTAQIASKLGAKVIKFSSQDDFSRIRNFALKQANYDWILFLDADEIVTPDLADEIRNALTSDFSGFMLQRIDYMWNQQLHFGDTGNVYLLRLARKSQGLWCGAVHETWTVSGKIGKLSQPLFHYPHPSMYEFLDSIDHYSTIRAQELFTQHFSANLLKVVSYPFGKFFQLWLLKLGFLDGTAGFIHAMTMSFYSFLVQAKLYFLYAAAN